MQADEPSTTQTSASHEWFTTTHWSMVRSAAAADSSEAQSSLATLCQGYWYPLYAFARRQGQSPEDAQDQVQGFFARLIEKSYLDRADPEKGRFRTFLLVAFKRYMANAWDYDNREKRGGGREVISLDGLNTEVRYRAEPVDEVSPEKVYEKQWALTLLRKVLDTMESEFSATGKVRIFQELKVFLNGEKGGTYAQVGARLGMSETSVKVTVHRLRQRYRELLRLEIANTVSSEEMIENEIRALFEALS